MKQANRGFTYRIVVEGSAGQPWTDWFDGLRLEYRLGSDGNVIATDFIYNAPDASALHGVLAQIGNLGLRLVSVERLDGEENEEIGNG